MEGQEEPQTVFQKVRNSILRKAGVYPQHLGRSNEANLQKLTKSKVSTIRSTESVTGRKLDWQGKSKEGD